MRQTAHIDEIYATAADWHSRLDEGEASHAEFDAWLAADARHRTAFDAMERMWGAMGAARSDERIVEVRRRALNATHFSMQSRRYAMAASVVVTLGVAAWLAWPSVRGLGDGDLSRGSLQNIDGGTLRTALGERASVTLPDGSVVVLNTSSRVDIRFTSGERLLKLVSGQAWFQVAKNPQRPFVVEAGHQRVTALGTAFDVRIDERHDTVQVALAEGRVSVEPIASPLVGLLKPKAKPAELAPGEALIASGDAPANKRKADITRIASWRKGQVVFDNDTLEAAVAEVNRYSATQIELADPAIGAYRVSGVFKAGHSDSFIETVTGHYPLHVAQRANGHIVLGANAP